MTVTPAPPPVDSVTLSGLFAASVARSADRVAVFQDERTWTYAELDAWATTVAHRLRDLGVRAGSRVGIYLPNSVQWIVTALATARLGAMILPVNLRYRPDELRGLLRGARPDVLVLTEHFLTNPCVDRLEEALPGLAAGDPPADAPRMLLVDGARSWANAFPDPEATPSALDIEVAESDPLIAFWTSGTTGEPKGVVHPHGALRNVWSWTSLVGYGPSEVVLTVRPFYYIAGAFWSLFGPLAHGAAIVIAQRLNADELLPLMARHGVTVLLGGPQGYETLLQHPLLDQLRGDLRLRRGSFGGGPPAPGFVRRVKERLGIAALVQVYGMTELQGYASSTSPDDPEGVTQESVGRPLPGFEFDLRDEAGRPVSHGVPGELFVRGNTFLGYFRDGSIAPATDAEGWFATGDVLVRRLDGNYVFHSRVRDVTKVRGENVALAEIDAVLEAIPGVARAIAIAIPDAREGSLITAVVAPVAGVALSAEAVVDACRARLAPFKVPRSVVLVAPTFEWPATVTGKLQRERVRELVDGSDGV
jgi:acyl-CoA synthetase (AMP-forming)/AMP-acid ligase II